MRRRIPARVYAEVLYEAARGVGNDRTRVRALVGAFMRHVARHGGRSRMRDIMKVFSRVADEKEGRVRVQLTVANDRVLAVDDNHLAAVPDTIGGLKTYVETSIDTRLIGGVRARIGDTLVDNSLRTRIEKLGELFS